MGRGLDIRVGTRALLAAAAAAIMLGGCGEGGAGGDPPQAAEAPPAATKRPGPDGGVTHRLDKRDLGDLRGLPALPGAGSGEPVVCAGADEELAGEELVGKGLAEAERIVARTSCSLRVVARDGRPLAVTEDYVPSRINVAVRNDEIIRVDGFY